MHSVTYIWAITLSCLLTSSIFSLITTSNSNCYYCEIRHYIISCMFHILFSLLLLQNHRTYNTRNFSGNESCTAAVIGDCCLWAHNALVREYSSYPCQANYNKGLPLGQLQAGGNYWVLSQKNHGGKYQSNMFFVR